MSKKGYFTIFAVAATLIVTLSIWSIININRDIVNQRVDVQAQEDNKEVNKSTKTIKEVEKDGPVNKTDDISEVGAVTITPKEELLRIGEDTEFILKKHYIDDDKVTEEAFQIPDIFIGLTKDELYQYTRDYIKKPNISDLELKLSDYIINEFSRDKLVLTKVYESKKQEEYYYITITDHYITIYYDDKTTIKEVTSFSEDMLNEEIVILLKNWVKVYGEQGIIELLENYTS